MGFLRLAADGCYELKLSVNAFDPAVKMYIRGILLVFAYELGTTMCFQGSVQHLL